MEKWKIMGQETVCDFKIFKFYKRHLFNKNRQSEHHFYVMDTPDWVNVVALTPDEKIVLVKQYRAGTDEITLEIPGGVIDKTDISPEIAALRELEEETAYIGQNPTRLGRVHPNPSFMANSCYFVLVKGVKPLGKLNFDSGEDIETVEMTLDEVRHAIQTGTLRHSLSIAALGMLFLEKQS